MASCHVSQADFAPLPMKSVILLPSRISALLCAMLGVFCGAIIAAGAAEKPNILFILADDLGYADTGFSGGKDIRTPALDKLAREGAVLEALYAQPVCSPTRAALMTGRYAVHTGVYTIVRPGAAWGLPLSERTLANALRDAGYETSLCGKWHLGEFQTAYQPMKRGFDHQYGPWFGAIDYFTHKRGNIVDWHRDDQPLAEDGYTTHLLTKEACRLMRAKQPGKPIFLYLSFNAVHAPHEVPASYTASYDNLTGVRRTYAGMLAAMDEAIGKVVAELEATGLRKSTLVIFSSDNGGPRPGAVTDNGAFRAGKGTLYEGGVRVCGFANWPGHIEPGQRIPEPIHMVDWYPTLVKLAGGSTDQKLPLDGRDIWPVLTAKAKSPHEAILLCSTAGPQPVALRAGDWKLLVGGVDDDGGKRSAGDQIELYNLAADPGEKKDLAAARPDKVKELHAQLAAMMQSVVPPGEKAARRR